MTTETIATPTIETQAPAVPKSPAKRKPAALLREKIEQTAASDMIVRNARAELRELAKRVFKTPITTAKAADTLGLDISTKGLDREDENARAWVQRCRVTLQRALNDAGVLHTDTGKGRKRKTPTALEQVLALLPKLSDAERANVDRTCRDLGIKA